MLHLVELNLDFRVHLLLLELGKLGLLRVKQTLDLLKVQDLHNKNL